MYKVVFYQCAIKELIGRRSVVWLKGLIALLIIVVRSGIHSSSSEQMSSSCCEEDAADCRCKGSLAPRAAGKGPACGTVVCHICLRSPAILDSWEGCDSSHYSPAHTSHLNWEGKWPRLPSSLDAAPGLWVGVQSCLPRCCRGQAWAAWPLTPSVAR